MRSVTRIPPRHDDEERRFFDRRSRRRSAFDVGVLITEEELLADLDPGVLTWRAAGGAGPAPAPARSSAHLHDVA